MKKYFLKAMKPEKFNPNENSRNASFFLLSSLFSIVIAGDEVENLS